MQNGRPQNYLNDGSFFRPRNRRKACWSQCFTIKNAVSQVDPILRNKINKGEILFIDQHLSESAESLHTKNLLNIDVAVIEAAYIERDRSIVPTTSVGNSFTFAALAKKVIIEINLEVPEEVYGIHDIYQAEDYPYRNVIPIVAPWNKIGRKSIPVDPEKIVAIVFTNKKDSPADIAEPDTKTIAIAKHIIEFFENEVRLGRLTDRLLPLQAGIGKVANAVLTGFKDSNFYDLTMFSEVLQDSTSDLIDAGKLILGRLHRLPFRKNATTEFSETFQNTERNLF